MLCACGAFLVAAACSDSSAPSNTTPGGAAGTGSAVGGTGAVGQAATTPITGAAGVVAVGHGGSGGSAPGGAGGSMIASTGGRGGAGGRASATGDGGAGPSAGVGGVSGSSGGGAAGMGIGGMGGSAGAQCTTMTGAVTYTLAKAAAPTAAQQAAYQKITTAMDLAVTYYNCYTDITKHDNVSYEPSVSTADGNVNGSIRFGSTDSMNYITAMHEISHSVGVGSSQFDALVMNGTFTGQNATAQLRAITGNAQDVVHGDTQHFWPYGLNYTTEVKSSDDLVNHCKMVVAIRKDIGL